MKLETFDVDLTVELFECLCTASDNFGKAFFSPLRREWQ